MNRDDACLPEFLTHPWPDIYRDGIPLFLDFETTTHNKGLAIYKENSLLLACWQEGWKGKIESLWSDEFHMDRLLEAIRRCDFIVAHNAKFELQWLARCGYDLGDALVYDTMIAEAVIGGNRWQTGQLGLNTCAKRHGIGTKDSLVSAMIKAGADTRDIPQAWLEKYCAQDVALLPKLMESQLRKMAGTRLLPVVYSRCLLTPVLADLETVGLQLDADKIKDAVKAAEKELAELDVQLNLMTGGINLASPLQAATFLYDVLGFEELVHKRKGKWEPKRTPTGRRLTGADVIESLKATTPLQRDFQALYIQHRTVYSQLTKYLRKFKACCDENNGVLMAQFNQTNTQTHRLSSSGLDYRTQLQNLPRIFKPLFKARKPGHLTAEADGAQLEFRIAAHLGRDEVALQDIRDKVDVHSFTAKVLTDAGQETDRQGAKEHTFKPLYGGSSGTPAEQTYYRAFKERYKGIADTQGKWINTVLMDKSLETEWGLRYYWPDTYMDRSGYITNTTAICNYPVQAMATAEVIPLALVYFWHRLRLTPDSGIVLCNTVHDSIIAEIAPDSVKLFHELAQQCLIYDAEKAMKDLYGIDLVCPLGCGVKVGTHWGTGSEVKYDQEERAAA